MAARTNQISSVADSIKALMDALQDEILPSADELRRDGWVTAKDYAEAIGSDQQGIKLRLDRSPNVERKMAKNGRFKVSMYRVKK
jgi:hypothetical protein